jgi:hypothetical protein
MGLIEDPSQLFLYTTSDCPRVRTAIERYV